MVDWERKLACSLCTRNIYDTTRKRSTSLASLERVLYWFVKSRKKCLFYIAPLFSQSARTVGGCVVTSQPLEIIELKIKGKLLFSYKFNNGLKYSCCARGLVYFLSSLADITNLRYKVCVTFLAQ